FPVVVPLAPHPIRCRGLSNPETNLERPRTQLGHVFLTFDLQGANECGRTSQLVEREQAQRVPHQDTHACRSQAGIPESPHHQSECCETQVGFRLAAASWKK